MRSRRPVLEAIGLGRDALEAALDRERRTLMRADEARMARYRTASAAWASAWPDVSRRLAGLSLPDAHRLMVECARNVLPLTVPGTDCDA